MFSGYLRQNGTAGIRNSVLVLYTVNCAAFVARQAGEACALQGIPVHVTGNGSCFDHQSVIHRMLRLIAHPNVGSVVLVGHGCEFIQTGPLADFAHRQGKPVRVVMDQQLGTRRAIAAAEQAIWQVWEHSKATPRLPIPLSYLTVGVVGAPRDGCARAVEATVRELLARNARVVLDTLPEGAELAGGSRAAQKRHRLRRQQGALPCGDAGWSAGLEVRGTCQLNTLPPGPGVWYLDALPDREEETGYPATDLTQRAADLICSGAQLVLAAPEQGCVMGPVVAPALTMTDREEIARRFPGEVDCLLAPAGGDELGRVLEGILGGAPSVGERLGIFEGDLPACEQERPLPPCATRG